LVVSYYKSDAGKNGLEEETRKTWRRVIEKFRTEHGDKGVALLQRGHVEKMLAEILAQGHSRPHAGRDSYHAQGRPDCGHPWHQAA